ncbi:MAG: hypothetical protein C5B60_02570 [Chloroflexi bacterium]|nr:MAG: hypothetical protein C5B60_02570 [Chloroflexota bacterium]
MAGLATMPSRQATFPVAFRSIIGQVDRLYLYLDGHTEVPECARSDRRVEPVFAADLPGLAGAGKFIPLFRETAPFLFAGIDDDIEYPDDHVASLRAALEACGGRAVVGYHGCLFRIPFESYYHDRVRYYFGREVSQSRQVDVLGANAVMFDTAKLRFDVREWPGRNTSDLFLAIEARKRGLPLIRLARRTNFPRPIASRQADSIYLGMQRDDKRQTDLAKRLIAAGAGTVPMAFFCPVPVLVATVPRDPANYWQWINGELDKLPPIPRPDKIPLRSYHGPYGWSIQSWMYLRDEIDVHLLYQILDVGMTLAHSDFWPKNIVANERQFFVEIKPDRNLKLANPDAVICQTAEDPLFDSELARQGRVFAVQNWPQNNLIRRNPQRRHVTTACFHGNSANLLTSAGILQLRTRLQDAGIDFCMPARPAWHDYSNCDVVVAVRRPEHFEHEMVGAFNVRTKPAAKLINAWHAGVPAILSPDPAYERLRRSDLDYITATTVDEIVGAVRLLEQDHTLYQAMVENGARRATDFTVKAVAQSWIELLSEKILPLAREKFGAVCQSSG